MPTSVLPHAKSPSALGKLILSIGFIIVSAAYAVWQHLSGPSATTAVSSSQSYKEASGALLETITQITGASGAPVAQPQAPSGAQKPSGLYADGSYAGSPFDAYYGTVQVKAIVRNGQIADVQFLQHPDSQPNSRFINDQAMPLLTQEAIQAQNAQVSGVSGATFTSEAFVQSLASALVQAQK